MQNLDLALVSAIVALLLAAAWRDLATRTIPHWAVLGILPLALCLRARHGGIPLLDSVLVAFAILGFLTLLHAKGFIGGGDVKLAAVVALALSPLQTLQFLEATALIGGVLALIYLLAGRLEPHPRLAPERPPGKRLLRRVAAVELRRIHKRGPLPYGIALAAAAALILIRT